MLTTRENYDDVEGFKEGVVLGEDVDFGKRSIQAGAKYHFYFRPQVIASLRRAHKMGRMRIIKCIARGYFWEEKTPLVAALNLII